MHTCTSPHSQMMDVGTGKCAEVRPLRGFCRCDQQLQALAFDLSCIQRTSSVCWRVITSCLSLKRNFPCEMQLHADQAPHNLNLVNKLFLIHHSLKKEDISHTLISFMLQTRHQKHGMFQTGVVDNKYSRNMHVFAK